MIELSQIDRLEQEVSFLKVQVKMLGELYLQLKQESWTPIVTAAKKLGVSDQTLKTRIKSGQAVHGTHYQMRGRKYFINVVEFSKLLGGTID